jgi:aryl-alcohol dehydrogenase-like predicted oxidoreductase
MEFRKIESIGIPVSLISLGTWAFGGDKWWGPQEDRDSLETLRLALSKGISLIDTAPIYGRGRSEKIIGIFFKKHKLRTKIILATKVGLSWDGPKILHNLKKKRIFEEVSASQKRLQTDYFDLYQVHWPDPDTPIPETAEAMRDL